MCVIERAVALNSYLLCCGLTCVCVCVHTRARARICMLLCLSTCNKLQCHSKFRPILRTPPSRAYDWRSSRPTSDLRSSRNLFTSQLYNSRRHFSDQELCYSEILSFSKQWSSSRTSAYCIRSKNISIDVEDNFGF